jgi:hypothetical protein
MAERSRRKGHWTEGGDRFDLYAPMPGCAPLLGSVFSAKDGSPVLGGFPFACFDQCRTPGDCVLLGCAKSSRPSRS